MRQCSKCKQNKAAEDFNKNQGYCKECQKEYKKAYYEQNREKYKARYQQNREKRREYDKAYYQQNREKVKARREQNREKYKEYLKTWRKQNRDKRRIYERNKHKTDINFKLSNNLRTRIREVLNGKSKSKKTMDLIGCSADFLKKHLEKCEEQEIEIFNYEGLIEEWKDIDPEIAHCFEIEMSALLNGT